MQPTANMSEDIAWEQVGNLLNLEHIALNIPKKVTMKPRAISRLVKKNTSKNLRCLKDSKGSWSFAKTIKKD